MVHLSIGNAGATVDITTEEYGHVIEINTSAFSNLDTKLKIRTNTEGLQQLADLFQSYAKANPPFKKGYYTANPIGTNDVDPESVTVK